MISRCAGPLALAALAALIAPLDPPEASAQVAGACRTLEATMTPTEDLQIVIWVEDEQGNYVDTAYITRVTGSFGLGNRPGMMEFNSGPLWPYGRRTTTFPVWARRHGHTFPLVVFQNGDEDNLSHPLGQSSLSRYYCRPMRESEEMWDAMSCATTAYTDKGLLADSTTSIYPPRSDLSSVIDSSRDHDSVSMMAGLNPFDAVSKATPAGDELYEARWAIPIDVPNGDYVVFAEVAREFDQNADYDYPAPDGIPWSEYGLPYRGQPSVLYRVPITVIDGETVARTLDYIGYGDPDGIDGDIRVPDATISTGTPGSGAERLLISDDGTEMFRLKVRAIAERDEIAPGSPSELQAGEITANTVSASFIAPGDDLFEGAPSQYEVRYLAGTPLTADNWSDATIAAVQIAPAEAGTIHDFTVDGLVPRTNYYIGVRAYDNCLNEGELEVLQVTTPPAPSGEVDACFIATAAYGSLMADDVSMLREFRDTALRGHVPGELLVAGYYTFGPALARLIEPSATARSAARSAMAPIVSAARRMLDK
jgi:hypothetical protein